MLTFHLFSDEKAQFLPERRPHVGLGTSLLKRLCLLSHALSILWASCLHRCLGLWEGWAEASEGLDPPGVPGLGLSTSGNLGICRNLNRLVDKSILEAQSRLPPPHPAARWRVAPRFREQDPQCTPQAPEVSKQCFHFPLKISKKTPVLSSLSVWQWVSTRLGCYRKKPILAPYWNCFFDLLFLAVVIIKTLPLGLTVKLKCVCSGPCPPADAGKEEMNTSA